MQHLVLGRVRSCRPAFGIMGVEMVDFPRSVQVVISALGIMFIIQLVVSISLMIMFDPSVGEKSWSAAVGVPIFVVSLFVANRYLRKDDLTSKDQEPPD